MQVSATAAAAALLSLVQRHCYVITDAAAAAIDGTVAADAVTITPASV